MGKRSAREHEVHVPVRIEIDVGGRQTLKQILPGMKFGHEVDVRAETEFLGACLQLVVVRCGIRIVRMRPPDDPIQNRGMRSRNGGQGVKHETLRADDGGHFFC